MNGNKDKELKKDEKFFKWYIGIEIAIVAISLFIYLITSIPFSLVYTVFLVLGIFLSVIVTLLIFFRLGPKWIKQQYIHFVYTKIIDYLLFAVVCFIAWLLFPILLMIFLFGLYDGHNIIEDKISIILLSWLSVLVIIGSIVSYFHAIRVYNGRKKYSLIPLVIFFISFYSKLGTQLGFSPTVNILFVSAISVLTVLPGYQLIVAYGSIKPEYPTERIKEIIADWKVIGFLFVLGVTLAEITLLSDLGDELEIIILELIGLSVVAIIMLIAMLYQYPEMFLIDKIDLLKAHTLYKQVESENERMKKLRNNSSQKILDYLDFIYVTHDLKS